MEEKVGIKATKEVVVFVVALVKAIVESLADGHVNIFDLFKFLKPLWLLSPVVKDFFQLKAEIMDLSDAEKEELCKLISTDLTLDNKMVEGYLEQALQTVVHLIDLIPFANALKHS